MGNMNPKSMIRAIALHDIKIAIICWHKLDIFSLPLVISNIFDAKINDYLLHLAR